MMKEKNLKFTGDQWVDVFKDKYSIKQIKENLKTWDPRNYRGDNCADNPARYNIL